jgi:REP element-mobilizing transposase RayT
MPRPPRTIEPGAIYHVTARGNRRQLLFRDDDDRRLFLTLLDTVAAEGGWRCLGYCLMPNHIHAVLTTKTAFSRGMQYLCGTYAQRFNRRYAVDGHLFQGRYHARRVESDSHLLEVSRYLALNPVRAGICARPDDWRWGSHRALLGERPDLRALDVEEALAHFGRNPEIARWTLRAFVDDPLAGSNGHAPGSDPGLNGTRLD